jgi:hypothetical protein
MDSEMPPSAPSSTGNDIYNICYFHTLASSGIPEIDSIWNSGFPEAWRSGPPLISLQLVSRRLHFYADYSGLEFPWFIPHWFGLFALIILLADSSHWISRFEDYPFWFHPLYLDRSCGLWGRNREKGKIKKMKERHWLLVSSTSIYFFLIVGSMETHYLTGHFKSYKWQRCRKAAWP